jgi:formylglycine-generating enzyme required for sulfatase activity
MKKPNVLISILSFLLLLTSCASLQEPAVSDQRLEKIRIDEVFVEGGTFRMGDAWKGENPDGKPVHKVSLNSFYIGTYEITQELYERVTGENPSYAKGEGLPVESITWYEAVLFCNRLSEINGLQTVYSIDGTRVSADHSKNGYRLPTEAEWEYAARSRGRDDRKWSGTNSEKELHDFAWYYNDDPHAHPVGLKKPNDLGIYDMTGNVEEWCWDWYGPYTASAKTDPRGPASGKNRVGRGGAWNWDADYSRTLRRDGFTPDKRYNIMGFRLARSAQ